MRQVKYLLIPLIASYIYLGVTYMSNVDMVSSIFFISFLWFIAISIHTGKGILDREATRIRDKIKKRESRIDYLSAKSENVKKDKEYLEKKLSDLSSLYAVTKEMSFTIRFSELFRTLKNFLKDHFEFRTFKVIVFGEKNEKRFTNKIYDTENGLQDHEDLKLDDALNNLIEAAVKSKKPIFLEDEKDIKEYKLDGKVKNIISVPLVIHKQPIAAILIEDIQKDDYFNYLILSLQVALQIERITLFDDVERLAIMDGLTGTYLRRFFLERFKEEISRAKQCNMKLSFIMADLDFFKRCNDTHGHLVGDVVLKEIAGVLKRNVREIDLVARYGGEEFCILLPEAEKSDALTVGERIRKAVERTTIKAYDESIKMTISMGISSFPEDSESLRELIEKADKALYKAKSEGKNKICLA